MVQPLLTDEEAHLEGHPSVDEAEGDDEPQLTFPSVIVMPGAPQIIFFLLLAIFASLAFTVLKHPLEDRGLTSADLLKYGSIPLISIVFTYLHIWLALWMTFYPLEYFGILQIPGTNTGLGWQGIIPFKAEKMARMAVQLMTQRLFDVREIFARLEPARVAAEMGPALHATLDEVITSVAQTHSPDLWALLPAKVKRELVNQAHEDAPPAIASLMREMQNHVTEIFVSRGGCGNTRYSALWPRCAARCRWSAGLCLSPLSLPVSSRRCFQDIEDMVVKTLMRDKPLLNNIFISCGHAELSFIRNSGAYMGGLVRLCLL